MNILQKAKELLMLPKRCFESEKTSGSSTALKYMLALQLVSAIGSTMFIIIARKSLPVDILIADYIFLYIQGILVILIIGSWTHLWAYLLGARSGFKQTLKAAFYAGTPVYLLGWIPESIIREYFVFLDHLETCGVIRELIFSLKSVALPVILLIYLLLFVLLWTGLQHLQELSRVKAAGTIIIAIAVMGLMIEKVIMVLLG